jgi:hypothetical protein
MPGSAGTGENAMPDGPVALPQEQFSGPVQAFLNYLTAIAEKPHTYNYDPPAGVARQNFSNETHSVSIDDIRGRENSFTLDQHGFAAVRHPTSDRDFDNEEWINRVYYPESEALLRQNLNAPRVLIFDHTVRRRDPAGIDREGARQPVSRVHVDQTVRSGRERIYRHLPDEAETLVKGRVRIINLWRPIRGPVVDHPLAVADGSSIQPQDLVATDLLYPDRTGETYSVTFAPGQRWHYWSAMQPDEALLLKCYDSVETGVTRFSPHTAFVDPRVDPASAPARQSIELRALVFGG